MLGAFDVVLIQERLHEPRSAALLHERLGWQQTSLPHIVLKGTGNGSPLAGGATQWLHAAAAARTAAAEATVRRMNALDTELYRWADAQFTDGGRSSES